MSAFFLAKKAAADRVSLTHPLGLRFLDVATNGFVPADVAIEPLQRESLGLEAEAWPLGAPRQKRTGIVTPSGAVAFHGFAGLRDFERSEEDDIWNSQPPARDFQVEVSDKMGRFLPCTFVVSAPQRGFALFAEDGSPPWIEAGAVPLFSAVSRSFPAGLAVVRAELHDHATGDPAAWALMEASYFSAGSRHTARGLADDKGRVLLMFYYPEGQRRAFNSSPPGSARGLSQQEWTLDVGFFYESADHPEKAADYGRRFAQPPAIAWRGSSPVTLLKDATVRFGQELDLGILDLVPA
ncbi:MAG TPA: hypothetical protein VN921_03405 [Chthoniobacterales bacterium]|nr:hypothetical protein [Chthoniobacterales bacterium]